MTKRDRGTRRDVWFTCFWTHVYEECALPAWVKDGTLRIACEYERFEWVEGEEGGEPHAIHASSADHPYELDIMFRSPAGEALLRLGLVKDVPADALQQLEAEEE